MVKWVRAKSGRYAACLEQPCTTRGCGGKVVRATAASRQWRHGKCPACWSARLRASAARRNSSEAQRTRACRAWASLGGTVLRGRWSEPGLILLTKKCHAINEGFHGHQSAPGTADTSVPMLLMNCAQQAKQEAVRLWEDDPRARVWIMAVGAQSARGAVLGPSGRRVKAKHHKRSDWDACAKDRVLSVARVSMPTTAEERGLVTLWKARYVRGRQGRQITNTVGEVAPPMVARDYCLFPASGGARKVSDAVRQVLKGKTYATLPVIVRRGSKLWDDARDDAHKAWLGAKKQKVAGRSRRRAA